MRSGRQLWAVLALLVLPVSGVEKCSPSPCNSTYHVLRCEDQNLADLSSFKNEECGDIHIIFLRGNAITKLEDGDLSVFPKVQTIDLQDNRVAVVEEMVFQELHELSVLNLARNIISDLGSFNLPRVTELDLRGNNLNPSGKEFYAPQLENLFLAECRLSRFTAGILRNTSKLDNLDLSKNDLQEVKSEWFEYTKDLTKLDISYNKVVKVDINSDHLKKLRVLDLSHNAGLEALRLEISEVLPQLETLLLVNTHLLIPENGPLLSHGAITKLSLAGSVKQYRDLPAAALSMLPKLQWLDLSENKLLSVEGAFDSIDSLQVLYLSENALTKLSDDVFAGIPHLSELYLDGNFALDALYTSVVEKMNELQVLDVSDTHMACFCSDEYWLLKYWANDTGVNLVDVCGLNPPCEQEEVSTTTVAPDSKCWDTGCSSGLKCCPKGFCATKCAGAGLPALPLALLLLLGVLVGRMGVDHVR